METSQIQSLIQRSLALHHHILLDTLARSQSDTMEFIRQAHPYAAIEPMDVTPTMTRAEFSRLFVEKPFQQRKRGGGGVAGGVQSGKTGLRARSGRERGHIRNISTESGGSVAASDDEASGNNSTLGVGNTSKLSNSGGHSSQPLTPAILSPHDPSVNPIVPHIASPPKMSVNPDTLVFLIWGLDGAKEEVHNALQEVMELREVEYMSTSRLIPSAFSVIAVVNTRVATSLPHSLCERFLLCMLWGGKGGYPLVTLEQQQQSSAKPNTQTSNKQSITNNNTVLSPTPSFSPFEYVPSEMIAASLQCISFPTVLERYLNQVLCMIRLSVDPSLHQNVPLLETRKHVGIAAKMVAHINDRVYVTPNDLRFILPFVICHKVRNYAGDANAMFANDPLGEVGHIDSLFCVKAGMSGGRKITSIDENVVFVQSCLKKLKVPM